MDPWLLFLTGFVAFPVGLLLLVLLARRAERVVPSRVRDAAQLQGSLRELLGDDSRFGILFLRDTETRLLIRVNKYIRHRASHTLGVELRRSESGVALYRQAREAIRERGFEFTEELTPKRRLPRRLRVLHPDGGPFAVTFVESVVSAINDALHAGGALDLQASNRQPGLWVAQRRSG